jgi:aspartate/methionine/tyrosine aminotransferase
VDVFRDAWPVAERAGWRLLSAGAFFAYVRHPLAGDGVSSGEAARRLADDHNLLAIPGTCFGPDGRAELRLAFGNVEHDVASVAVQRLAELG